MIIARVAQAIGVPLADLAGQIPTITGMSTGQLTQPGEVASLVVYLASDAARNMNGPELVLDGGLLKTT